ncbi:MAG TPA: methionine adenosyltransferase, partial [Candidatus Limnocylindria bacterium]
MSDSHRRIPFTSESVTEGHPDKLCDAVADAILDDVLANDVAARAAIEVTATTGLVLVLGELTTEAYCDVQSVVRRTVREIGYDDSRLGFDWETCGTLVAIKEQSPDIALGVDHAMEAKQGMDPDELGAGDQGMMFGYATDETPELMPMPIQLAHQVARRLAEVRKDGTLPFLRPDGKSQVTVEYDADGRPLRVDTVVVSTQHDPEVGLDVLTDAVRDVVVRDAVPEELLDDRTRYLVNPTGRFVIGGPMGDSGLSG